MRGPSKSLAFRMLLGLVSLCAGTGLAQGEISVKAAVSKNEVVVGEPFTYQIQVVGTQEVKAPDFAPLTSDFQSSLERSIPSTSEFRSDINGRVSQTILQTQTLVYQFRARKSGNFVIPEAEVVAGGRAYRTPAIAIRVVEAQATNDVALTTELSKNTCYVGEALLLKTVLYFNRNIDDRLSFELPLLDSDVVEVQPIPASPNVGRLDLYGKVVDVQREQATRQGTPFNTLVMRHLIIPKSPGRLEFPSATATVAVATGRRVRSGGFFTQAEYESAYVKAQPIILDVKPVPAEGKPDDYSGLVGSFTINATASPTEVKVGDPISLTITLTGSPPLQSYELPDLDQWPALAENFRTHEDTAPGKMEGERKSFVQTIRAKSDAVTEIPPITLSYFNADSGTYAVTTSKPIPLNVVEALTVTAADAEGFRATVDTVDHIAINEGIAHNFTGDDALIHQRFGPNVWLRTPSSWLFLLFPPFLYALLAGSLFVKDRGGLFAFDRRHAQALPVLETAIGSLDTNEDVYGPIFDALRVYLGTRLDRQSSALTYADVEPLLRTRGIGEEHLAELKEIFATCESHRYAGATEASADKEEFVARAKQCAQAINEELGR